MPRPRKHNRKKLLKALLAYIDGEDVPVIAEFAYQQGLHRQQVYEIAEGCPELSDAIKRCISKKEARLEKGALAGELNPSMAIFSLKQLGWKDTQAHEHAGPGGKPLAPPVIGITFTDGGPGSAAIDDGVETS